MNFHPHIHTILLGGGLYHDNKWKDKGENFFLPIQVISKVFRAKYLDELKNYGLLCSPTKKKNLTLCRNILGYQKYLSKLRVMEMPEILEHLYGIKICMCNVYGGHLGKLQIRKPLRC